MTLEKAEKNPTPLPTNAKLEINPPDATMSPKYWELNFWCARRNVLHVFVLLFYVLD